MKKMSESSKYQYREVSEAARNLRNSIHVLPEDPTMEIFKTNNE
jgi:hypothetical protein